MTKELFREDGYLKTCKAEVTHVQENGFVVDQTVFYPMGGGQPGDSGTAKMSNGESTVIVDSYKDRESGLHLHVVEQGSVVPQVGEQIELTIDWDRRYRLMRMHSCMHMLCVAVPAPVTGGAIHDGLGRLDFDLPDPPDKVELEQRLNEIIQQKHPMTLSWISDEEMEANEELIRTMSVKPPMGSGQVRLVKFGNADLQPCGGTHVGNSEEIGQVRIDSIKNKGKQNRRITVSFA